MSKNISLKKNFLMNIILTMSSIIFPLITFPYVSRVLGPVGTGKVSFASSVINYFSLFAQLGIPTYGIRVCAEVRDDHEKLTRTVQELLTINLIMDVITYAAFAVSLVIVPRFRTDRALLVVISSTIFLTSIGMEWLYKALEQYTYITVRSMIFKLVALVSMFLLVHQQSDYVIYGAISILASSASNVLNFVNAHHYIGFKPVGNYNFKKHLKPIGIFFAMSCATTIYTNLDTIMLGFMSGDAEVGYYNAAVKIKTVLVSVVTSLAAVLLPRASYYVANNDMNDFKKIAQKALNFTIIIALPLTIYFMLFAKQGIYFLSGDQYHNSILPMQWIMPTVLFIGISNITGLQILIPLGKEKIVLYSEVAGALTDLILNWLLIPHLLSTGAAIGTLAAEFVVLLVQFFAIKDQLVEAFKEIHYGRILLALILGIAASFWTLYLHMGDFITLLISAILFFGLYFVVLLVMHESIVTEAADTILIKLHLKH